MMSTLNSDKSGLTSGPGWKHTVRMTSMWFLHNQVCCPKRRGGMDLPLNKRMGLSIACEDHVFGWVVSFGRSVCGPLTRCS